MNPKQLAGERAVSYIHDGMTVGLGSGSTVAYALAALCARCQSERLTLRCIPTSQRTAVVAERCPIPLATWDEVSRFDLTIDGADEVDPQFRLIKGGGGALVREKIVASYTDVEIIVVDETKVKAYLGAFPLPVAVIPFAWQATRRRLENRFGCPARPRSLPSGEMFLSDDGLTVLDLEFSGPLPSPDDLEQEIKSLTGVVDVGLFIGHCQRLIIGFSDGRIGEMTPERSSR